MELVDKVNAILGKGGVSVTLLVDKDVYAQGETLRGRLVVRGGSVAQSLRSLSVGLIGAGEAPADTGGAVTRSPTRQVLIDQEQTVEPGSKKDFEYRLRIPVNAKLGACTLQATADMPRAVDAVHCLGMTIAPSAAVFSLMNAVQLLGFRLRDYAWAGEAIVARFDPLGTWSLRFDEVSLSMAQTESSVDIDLTVNLREQALGDYVKAAKGQDIYRERFSLDSGAIASEGEGYIVRTVRPLLEKYGARGEGGEASAAAAPDGEARPTAPRKTPPAAPGAAGARPAAPAAPAKGTASAPKGAAPAAPKPGPRAATTAAAPAGPWAAPATSAGTPTKARPSPAPMGPRPETAAGPSWGPPLPGAAARGASAPATKAAPAPAEPTRPAAPSWDESPASQPQPPATPPVEEVAMPTAQDEAALLGQEEPAPSQVRADPQLAAYVAGLRAQGYADAQIAQHLRDSGYAEADVQAAMG